MLYGSLCCMARYVSILLTRLTSLPIGAFSTQQPITYSFTANLKLHMKISTNHCMNPFRRFLKCFSGCLSYHEESHFAWSVMATTTDPTAIPQNDKSTLIETPRPT